MNIRYRICRWINRHLTFEHIAVIARAADVPMRSLVALHPSFHSGEKSERIAA